jgi:hypothetical protein
LPLLTITLCQSQILISKFLVEVKTSEIIENADESSFGMALPISAKLTPLVVITSNNERTLPKAFLRRCIVHWLDHPGKEMLVKIAHQHFPTLAFDQRSLLLFETCSCTPASEGLPPSLAQHRV